MNRSCVRVPLVLVYRMSQIHYLIVELGYFGRFADFAAVVVVAADVVERTRLTDDAVIETVAVAAVVGVYCRYKHHLAVGV